MLHRITKSGRTAAVAAALAVAVAGAGSATAASLVTGADVKNASLTGTDVKNGSLKRADLSPGVRDALDAGGGPGPAGPAGLNGADGATIVRVATDDYATVDHLDQEITHVTLPAGTHLIEAKAVLDNASSATEGRCELYDGDSLLDFSLATLADNRANTVALSAPVRLGSERTISLRCESGNVALDPIAVRRAVLTATEVQQLLDK